MTNEFDFEAKHLVDQLLGARGGLESPHGADLMMKAASWIHKKSFMAASTAEACAMVCEREAERLANRASLSNKQDVIDECEQGRAKCMMLATEIRSLQDSEPVRNGQVVPRVEPREAAGRVVGSSPTPDHLIQSAGLLLNLALNVMRFVRPYPKSEIERFLDSESDIHLWLMQSKCLHGIGPEGQRAIEALRASQGEAVQPEQAERDWNLEAVQLQLAAKHAIVNMDSVPSTFIFTGQQLNKFTYELVVALQGATVQPSEDRDAVIKQHEKEKK